MSDRVWAIPFRRAPENRWWAFLLDELGPDEHEAVEARLLEDADAFEEVVAAEHDLLEAWTAGRLRRRHRERVQQYLRRHPSIARRADFAAALRARTDDRQARVVGARRSPVAAWRQYALAAGVALAVGAAAWSGWQLSIARDRVAAERMARQTDRQQYEQRLADEQRQLAALSEQLKNAASATRPAPAAPPTRGIIAFSILAGVRSSDAVPRLVIPRGTPAVLLELDAETLPPGRVRAVLRRSGGREVWTADAAARDGAVTLTIPAATLMAATYDLTLEQAGAHVASYNFAVSRP